MKTRHLACAAAMLAAALLTACGEHAAAAATTTGPRVPASAPAAPLELHGGDFPALAHLPDVQQMYVMDATDADFPSSCTQVRAATPAELVPRWRDALVRISLRCEQGEADADGPGMVLLSLSAPLRPHAAQLGGLGVLEARSELGEISGSQSYLLDAPLAKALQVLRPRIEAWCRRDHAGGGFQTDCLMHEEDGSWRVETGELNNGTWLQADPDNPARTLYSEGWAD